MTRGAHLLCERSRRHCGGYIVVLFVIMVAFVGVVIAMHTLMLASVATSSRAYDSYRQGTVELMRLERAVTETLLDQRQISVASPPPPLAASLNEHLQQLCAGGATISVLTSPIALPRIISFPDAVATADPLSGTSADIGPWLTPELTSLVGPRFANYPVADFEFSSDRTVLDSVRHYKARVRAQLIAVPLTRFAISAYDLPSEIGTHPSAGDAPLASVVPSGLVPSRDRSFIADLQNNAEVLPYHFRRRAALSAAYQYVFSQSYVDRVAEYAGITHFRNLDLTGGTAALAGMSQAGNVTTWDIGVAGLGTYGSITMTRDATVVFTEHEGLVLQLKDSIGSSSAAPLLILLLGPSTPGAAPLAVNIESISRPIVIVGYNIHVTTTAAATLNGALFLDPASSIQPNGSLTAGHLSYWAGSTGLTQGAVVAGPMPVTAEEIAPRVVYVATQAARL